MKASTIQATKQQTVGRKDVTSSGKKDKKRRMKTLAPSRLSCNAPKPLGYMPLPPA